MPQITSQSCLAVFSLQFLSLSLTACRIEQNKIVKRGLVTVHPTILILPVKLVVYPNLNVGIVLVPWLPKLLVLSVSASLAIHIVWAIFPPLKGLQSAIMMSSAKIKNHMRDEQCSEFGSGHAGVWAVRILWFLLVTWRRSHLDFLM